MKDLTPLLSTLSYRSDLQGLRAVSISLVVLAHAGISLLPGGFIGVDVFFVLSGYLITGLLIQEYSASGRINFLQFIARRLKRLLPALFVMLFSMLLVSSALLSNYQLTQQASSINYAVTWTSNLFFAFSTIDYFSELKAKDLFLHTWSLSLEEQFYLIWPLTIFLILSIFRKQSNYANYHAQLLVILGIFFLASFGLSCFWSGEHPLWAFYTMPSRLWQFALGAGTFVLAQTKLFQKIGYEKRYASFYFARTLRVLGLGLILCSAALFHAKMTYPGFGALLPSIGAVLVILAGTVYSEQVPNGLLNHPALVWLGDRSYSWYLWHWPVLMLGFSLGINPSLAETVALIFLSLALAMLSYQYIEKPFWKGAFSQANFLRVVLLSVLAMLTLVWIAEKYLQVAQQYLIAQQKLSPAGRARSDLPIIYADGCDAFYSNSDLVPCIYGKNDARRTVVLLGDSIGAQWFSVFHDIFIGEDWRIIVLTKSSCPMVDEDVYNGRIKQIYTICSDWRNRIFPYLEGIRPQLVIFGSDPDYGFSRTQWVEGSERVLARLTKIATNVVVLAGTSHLSFDGPSCLEINLYSKNNILSANDGVCKEMTTNNEVNKVTNYLNEAAQRFRNARLLDLNDVVCPNGLCGALDYTGHVVFRDSHHLTDSFVRAQVAVVRHRLLTLGVVAELVEP